MTHATTAVPPRTSSALLLDLVEMLRTTGHQAHLLELAAATACENEMAREAIMSAAAGICNRVADVADELQRLALAQPGSATSPALAAE